MTFKHLAYVWVFYLHSKFRLQRHLQFVYWPPTFSGLGELRKLFPSLNREGKAESQRSFIPDGITATVGRRWKALAPWLTPSKWKKFLGSADFSVRKPALSKESHCNVSLFFKKKCVINSYVISCLRFQLLQWIIRVVVVVGKWHIRSCDKAGESIRQNQELLCWVSIRWPIMPIYWRPFILVWSTYP